MEDKLINKSINNNQKYPFYSFKLLVETFKYCRFEPTNENARKLLKDFFNQRGYKVACAWFCKVGDYSLQDEK